MEKYKSSRASDQLRSFVRVKSRSRIAYAFVPLDLESSIVIIVSDLKYFYVQ